MKSSKEFEFMKDGRIFILAVYSKHLHMYGLILRGISKSRPMFLRRIKDWTIEKITFENLDQGKNPKLQASSYLHNSLPGIFGQTDRQTD